MTDLNKIFVGIELVVLLFIAWFFISKVIPEDPHIARIETLQNKITEDSLANVYSQGIIDSLYVRDSLKTVRIALLEGDTNKIKTKYVKITELHRNLDGNAAVQYSAKWLSAMHRIP